MSELGLGSEATAMLDRAREFARDDVAPHAAAWEGKREFQRAAFKKGAGLGLAGLLIAKDLGGVGMSHVAAAQVYEELAGACLPFCFTLFVHHNVAAGIASFGSRDQKDRYLQPMLRGERIGAFCMTESTAGSDAAAISMMARPDGDGWRLEGEKSWVTNGSVADVLSIYSQTDRSLGARGIACFLVETPRKEVERTAPYPLMGGHVMGVNGIKLNDCRVGPDGVLREPGLGFKGAMAGINRARTMIAAMCCGILRASLEATLEYARTRKAFGRTLSEFQGLQFELAEVATDLAAAEALSFQAAAQLDQGKAAVVEAAHAKKFATRAAFNGIATCMRAMGANGYRTENVHARHLASAQMCEYLDGPEEIQNLIIARSLFPSARRS